MSEHKRTSIRWGAAMIAWCITVALMGIYYAWCYSALVAHERERSELRIEAFVKEAREMERAATRRCKLGRAGMMVSQEELAHRIVGHTHAAIGADRLERVVVLLLILDGLHGTPVPRGRLDDEVKGREAVLAKQRRAVADTMLREAEGVVCEGDECQALRRAAVLKRCVALIEAALYDLGAQMSDREVEALARSAARQLGVW